MPYKTELHMHTGDISVCARVTPEEAVRDYKAAGYRTIVVTNHMNRATFQHMVGASWEEQIQWYVTARKRILDYADAALSSGWTAVRTTIWFTAPPMIFCSITEI